LIFRILMGGKDSPRRVEIKDATFRFVGLSGTRENLDDLLSWEIEALRSSLDRNS
jgi:hypothetical protein